jgi:hypothetical protein
MTRVPFFTQRRAEEQVTRYILREHASGRFLEEILLDREMQAAGAPPTTLARTCFLRQSRRSFPRWRRWRGQDGERDCESVGSCSKES